MIIEMKAHPAFQRRENDAAFSAVDELQSSLIKGLTANITLIERALERFKDQPCVESRKLLVNSRLTLDKLLINLESEEDELTLLGDTFIERYAMLKARLVMARAEMEAAIDNFVEPVVVPPPQTPVEISVTVVSRPNTNLYWQIAGLVTLSALALVIVL